MIFTVQFDVKSDYSDNIQRLVGARDNYESWTQFLPNPDFVNYYCNADGSKFEWAEVEGLEDWDKLTPEQREVFFCRDGLNTVQKPKWKDEVIKRVGKDVLISIIWIEEMRSASKERS